MLKSRFQNAVVGAAMAAAVAFGAAAPAQAAVYNGSWDPAFGAAFPQLGWNGEGTFFIPDACLALGAGLHLNSGACAGMELVRADVNFYDLSDSSHTPLETLHFTVPSTFVTSMRVDANHQLSGVVGAFGYLVPSNLNIAGGNNVLFGLAFLDNLAQMAYFIPDGGFGSSDLNPREGGQPFITFAPAVPEPSTYALFAAGLAAMWQIRRRRR